MHKEVEGYYYYWTEGGLDDGAKYSVLLQVEILPTRLTIKLHWYGRIFDGPLSRRCKASEAWWVLEDDEVHIMIPKDDPHFWRALFEGGEEKSHYEVLRVRATIGP